MQSQVLHSLPWASRVTPHFHKDHMGFFTHPAPVTLGCTYMGCRVWQTSCDGPRSRSRNENLCSPLQPACSHLNSHTASAGRCNNRHFPRLTPGGIRGPAHKRCTQQCSKHPSGLPRKDWTPVPPHTLCHEQWKEKEGTSLSCHSIFLETEKDREARRAKQVF